MKMDMGVQLRTEICLVDQFSDLQRVEFGSIRKMERLCTIITSIKATKSFGFGSQVASQLPAATHGATGVAGILGTPTQLATILQVALPIEWVGELLQHQKTSKTLDPLNGAFKNLQNMS